MRRRVEPSSPPLRHHAALATFSTCLLHGAHVEIEHALALVALFLILFSEHNDLFQNLHVESVDFQTAGHAAA
jgi:hypothetical protein